MLHMDMAVVGHYGFPIPLEGRYSRAIQCPCPVYSWVAMGPVSHVAPLYVMMNIIANIMHMTVSHIP